MIVPYSDEWPRAFDAERVLLEAALAPWLDGAVHHVGSTAVPGLAAKPVIDMVAGVRDLEAARDAAEPLAALDYAHGEQRPEALWFRKPAAAEWSRATHALHLAVVGSPLWQERLAFRDALRDDPALAREYERWKRAHAASPGDPSAYTASKTPFVTAVLADRGITLKPDAERLLPIRGGRRRLEA